MPDDPKRDTREQQKHLERLATLEDILARDDAGHATLLPESRLRFEDERTRLRELLNA